MVKLGGNDLPVSEILSMILSCLPLKADFLEAPVIYTCICDILDRQHPACNNILQNYLIVFVKSFMQTKLSDEMKSRIIVSMKLLGTGNGVGGIDLFNLTVKSIDNPEFQQVIQHMLSIQ